MRGAWIEMSSRRLRPLRPGGSRPMRGAWIEISCLEGDLAPSVSRPMRGAWIEIFVLVSADESNNVAPHAGRVD